MPILILLAIALAIVPIALAVMLISGVIFFMTNKRNINVENVATAAGRDIFEFGKKKVKEFKHSKKYQPVRTVEGVVIFVEEK